jgi:hypothetical protein
VSTNLSASINLTDPQYTRALSAEETLPFKSPLFISPLAVVLEVVFWSAPHNTWLHLVRDYTGRTLGPQARELSVSDIEAAWARHALGLHVR